MFYLAKTPQWIKKLYPQRIWNMPPAKKAIYLTFDDGPHPEITSFVLDELHRYNARATFFCVGKNVVDNPLVFNRILEEGHAVGNHTYDHLDGWKTHNAVYINNILKARRYINSDLFRPPFGRISSAQQKNLLKQHNKVQIIMWSVLSGDFDIDITPVQCSKNVIKNAESGSIVVFHDSEKAQLRLRYALPEVLKYFSGKGFIFEKLVLNS